MDTMMQEERFYDMTAKGTRVRRWKKESIGQFRGQK
jgi:hypothetical protein